MKGRARLMVAAGSQAPTASSEQGLGGEEGGCGAGATQMRPSTHGSQLSSTNLDFLCLQEVFDSGQPPG